MKSITNILHKTPWWALFLGAFAVLSALAVFVTPYHILDYRESDKARSSEERRAIKREVDNAFAENAMNVGSGVIRGMLARTTDPERRKELEIALEGLEEARSELREAGGDVLRARREAHESAREAARNAREAIRNARREAERALERVGPEGEKLREQIEKSLASAEEAEKRAAKGLDDAERAEAAAKQEQKDKGLSIRLGRKPPITVEGKATPPLPPTPPTPPGRPGPTASAGATAAVPGVPPVPAVAALPPEVRTRIHRDVQSDIYRIGIGAVVLLILFPLFVMAVITKFFVDRSRAAQRLADLKRKEAEYHRMGQQVTEAKLAALQAQVEPHFLYNTLASVQALTEVDAAKASAMTGHLIQYLRNALPKMRESVSTVGQEIELVRAYLSILQMRMGTRLTFDIAVPESIVSLPFPPLMLPSLVENAIKHGLEPQREGGNVHISGDVVDGRLRLIVADTGRGFAETIGAGVGLANIRERLAAMYGDAGKLTLEANAPRGVIATIEVPAVGSRGATPRTVSAAPAAAAPAAAAVKSSEAPATVGAKAKSAVEKTVSALAMMERGWRKLLYWVFIALLVAASVAALAGLAGVITGVLPVQFGEGFVDGPGGVVVGVAAIVVAFVAVVLAIAIVIAVAYGLGFLFVGLALFILLVVIGSLSPLLAPIVILGLLIWWAIRKAKDEGPRPAARTEPKFATDAPVAEPPPAPPSAPDAPAPGPEAQTPPPVPPAEPGR